MISVTVAVVKVDGIIPCAATGRWRGGELIGDNSAWKEVRRRSLVGTKDDIDLSIRQCTRFIVGWLPL